MSWSHLQSNSAANASCTYTSNLSAGTKLIAVTTVFATTCPSVKDGANNSFTKLASVLMNNNSGKGEVALWAMDTPAGDVGTTPTITQGSGSSFTTLLIQEVSGLLAGNTSAMLDGTAGTSFAAASTSLACGTYGSAAANEYLVAVYGDDQTTGGVHPTAASGSATYTLDAANIASGSAECSAVAYGNSTGGTETCTFTLSSANSNDQGTIFVAFKLAGGAATPAPVSLVMVNRPAFIVSNSGWRGAGHSR